MKNNITIRIIMRVLFLCGLSLLFYYSNCVAQVDSWEHSYGGTRDDSLQFIQQTSDGGFIMGGHSNSFSTSADNYDAWAVKLDSIGGIVWQKRYATSGDERFFCGQQTSDGGYIFGGSSDQISANADAWIVKTDSTGVITWQKVLAIGSYQEVRSIQQIPSDSSYIVLATSDNAATDFWVIKLTSLGTISWQKTIGGADIEEPMSIRQTADGGYLVAGGTFSFGAGSEDAYIFKLTSTGSLSWNRVLGGTNDDIFYYAIDTSDGGYIAVGSTLSYGTGGDVWVVKFNSSANITWQKRYGGTNFESGAMIIPLSDGYLIGADTDSFSASRDLWIFKIDTTGTMVWQKTYGGASGTDALVTMSTTTDGGYIIGAQTNSYGAGLMDFWPVKINADGTLDSACTVANTSVTAANSTATASTPSPTQGTPTTTLTNTTYSPVSTASSNALQCGCTQAVFNGISAVIDLDCCNATGIRVNWTTPSSWGIGSATTGTFDIRRYTTSDCSGSYITVKSTLSAATTTYIDTSGTANTQYYYQVRAKNNCNPAISTPGSVSPCVAGMDGNKTTPSGFSNNNAYDLGCFDTGVRVTWQQDPSNWGDNLCGTRTYNVLRDASSIASVSYANSGYTDLTGTNNQLYTYKVRYNNGCGLSADTSPGVVAGDYIGQAPSGLTNNTAVDLGCSDTGVQITWNCDCSNWGDGAVGTRYYDVLRAGTAITGLLSYCTTLNTNYIDTTGTNYTNYTYTVRYYNGCGYNTITSPGATAQDYIGIAPSGIPAITAADVDVCADTGVRITWSQDPADWGDNGINSLSRTYDILRNGTVTFTGFSYGTTTFVDTTGTNGTNYLYSVRYNNGCSISTVGAQVTATDFVPVNPFGLTNNTATDVDTCTDTGVRVTWATDPGGNATNWGDNNLGPGARNYDVLRDGTTIASNIPYGTTIYIDTSGTNNINYNYTVKYRNKCSLTTVTSPGVSAQDQVASDPSGLTNNTATDVDNCEDTGVRITWTKDATDWGDHLVGTRTYDVLRNGTVIATGLPYAPTATTMFIDTTGTNNLSYTYTVRYVNGCTLMTTTAGVSGIDNVKSTPTGLTNNTAVDIDTCGDTGVRITWAQDVTSWGDNNLGVTRTYDVLRDGTVIISGLGYGSTVFIDTTGTNNQQYTYTVRYINGCLLSAVTSPGALATDNVGDAPAGLTNNTAADVHNCADTGVRITWVADAGDWKDNGVGPQARTYEVLRDGITIVSGIAYGTTQYIDTTGSNFITYTYKVKYVNKCNMSTVTNPGADAKDYVGDLPTGLTNNTATDVDVYADTGVLITWAQDPTDWHDNDIGTRTYEVLRGTTIIISGLAYGTTQYIDTTGSNNVQYTYTVRYTNGCGAFTDTTPGANATDNVCIAPAGLTNNTATDVDQCADTGVLITWPADPGGVPGNWNDNDVGAGLRTYQVLRSGILVTTLSYPSSSFIDTFGTNNIAFTYTVRYVNKCGLTADTTGVSATDNVGSVPSGLTNNTAMDVSTCADTGVQITWLADPGGNSNNWNDSNVGPGNRTYSVLRSGTVIASGLIYGSTSFIDTAGSNNTPYTYTVRYTNKCSQSTDTTGFSATDNVSAAPSGLTNNTATDVDTCADTGVLVTWLADPGGIETNWNDNGVGPGMRYYDVLRGVTVIASGLVYGSTNFIDTTGTNNTAYTYTVRYTNKCSQPTTTAGVSATDNVGAPPSGLTNNTATDVDTCADTGVLITWLQDPGGNVNNWNDSGVGSVNRTYSVLRGGTVIASGLVYGTTSFIDTLGTNNLAYTYTVRYTNKCSQSTDTTGVSATDNVGAVPTVPNNNTAVDVDTCADTGVRITWLADPGSDANNWNDSGVGPGNRNYSVLRGGTVIASNISYNTTQYIDTTGTNNQSYLYTVRYTNKCSQSTDTTGTSATDNVGAVPSGLTNNTAVDVDTCADSGVLITWLADPGGNSNNWNDSGVGSVNRTYSVLRAGTVIASNIAYGTTQFIDTTGTNNQSYLYTVRYTNKCSQSTDTTGTSATDNVGAPPSGLTNNTAADVDTCADTGVLITWLADPGGNVNNWNDSGVGAYARTYSVLRSGTIIASGLTYGITQFIDTAGSNNLAYTYTVRYTNKCSQSTDTTGVSATDNVGAAPSGLTNNTAVDVNQCSDTGVLITWLQDPGGNVSNWNDSGVGPGARNYSVLRGGTVIASNITYGTTQFTDTLGTNNQSYLYTVRYTNKCGQSTDTTGVSATDNVGAAPVPGNNTATDIDVCLDTGVLITWQADPNGIETNWYDNNVGPGNRTYNVYRGATLIASSLAYGTTSFIDTLGTNNVPYIYLIRYVNKCYQYTDTAGTTATDNVSSAPISVSSIAADVNTCADTGVQITWTADPGGNVTNWNDNGIGPGNRTYDVYRGAVLIASSLVYGSTNFIDTLGTNNIAYTYTVRYTNKCGLSTTSTGNSATDNVGAAPTVPNNNTAADVNTCTDTGVQITWAMDPGSNPSNWNDNGIGTRTYRILRDGSVIGSVLSYGTTSFIDTTGTNNQTYTYTVRYINGCGQSTDTTGTTAVDNVSSAPTGLTNNTAADIDTCADTGVRINWLGDPGGNVNNWNDNSIGTRTYDVLRGATVIGSGLVYGTTTFVDTLGTNNTAYTYTVRYVNGCGQSSTTTGASATDNVGAAPSGLNNNTAADVNTCADTGVLVTWQADPGGSVSNWNDNGFGTRSYTVLRDGTPIATNITYLTIAFTDTTGTNNQTYLYQVRYTNGCAQSTATAGTTATDWVPSTPTGLDSNTATDIDPTADTGVRITWAQDPTPATGWNDNNIGSRTYQILRDGNTIATGISYGTTQYIDTTGTNFQTYLYTVRYVNGCGLSAVTSPGASAADVVCSSPAGLTNNTAVDIDNCLDTGVLITWTPDATNWGDSGVGTRTYDILRNGIAIKIGITYLTTTYIDTTSTNNLIYTYTVRYNNGCAMNSTTTGANAADYVASAPSGLTNNTAADIDNCADTGVRITWLADPGGNANNWNDNGFFTRTYDILRGGIAIATGLSYSTTSFIDTTGTNNLAYTYQVRYVNGCGLSTPTTGASAIDNVASAPSVATTNNTAADVNTCADTGVKITWPKDPDNWNDNGFGTRTYDVLRDGIPISTGIAYNTTTYTDTMGTNNQTYLYTVRYNSGCGLSTATTGASAADLVGSVPTGLTNNTATDVDTCADTGVQITWLADPSNWNDNNIGTRTYDVLRNGSVIKSGLAYGITSYIDTSGTNGISYSYTVRYNNGCALSATTTGVSVADLVASAPTGLTNNTAADIDVCLDTGVRISWTQDPTSWNDNSIGTRTYDVLRGGTPIATGIAYGITSFIDTTGTNNLSYTYTVRYVNGCGISSTSAGASATDNVASVPSSIINNGAVDVTGCSYTGVRITWVAPGNWGDNGFGTRTYDVLRDGTPIATGLSSSTFSFIDTTGTHDQIYLYQVRYNNGCTLSSTSAGASAADYTSSVPSGLTNNGAADVDGCLDTGAQVTWLQDPASWGDNGTGTRYYRVYRNGVSLSLISYPNTIYIDTTGTNNTSYTYRVLCINGCGSSSYAGSGASAMDHIAAVPSGLTNNTAADLDNCADTGVRITWTQNPTDWGDGGTGTRTYDILRNGTAIAMGIAYGVTIYIDTIGTNNISYAYTVIYVNGCGLSTATAGANAIDNVGDIPSGLANNTAADVDTCADTGARITWLANPSNWNDNSIGTRTYDILRDGNPIITGIAYNTTSFIDTTGTNNIAYIYTVRYVNGCGLSAITIGVSATDNVGSAPAGLTNNTATDVDTCADTGVRITWLADPSNWNDNSMGTRTYDVLRNGVTIAGGLAYGTTIYIDTSGTNNSSYAYTVRYNNGCGLSSTSSGTSAADLVASNPTGLTNNTAADIDPAQDTGVLITWAADPTPSSNWNDNNIGSRTYDVLRDGVAIASGISYGTTTFIDTTGTNAVTYLYQVRYVNGCGLSATTSGVPAEDVVCTPPSGLTSNFAADADSCADTGVQITWTPDVTNWGDSGIGTRSYNVLRNGISIATISYPSSNFLDTTGTNNTIYSYSIRYNNGCAMNSTTSGANAADYVGSAPSGLTNNTAADIDNCADTGVRIIWLADPGGNATNWNDNGFFTRTYDILRGGVAIATGLSYGTTSFIDTTGTNNLAYTYQVRYVNGCGLSTPTIGATATDNVASAPSVAATNNMAADVNTCADTGVTIAWPKDPDNWNDNGFGTRTYDVLRDGIPIVTGIAYNTTTYTDTTGTNNQTYLYTVRYNNGCGLSAATTGASAADLVGTAPTGLTNNTAADADTCADTGVQITWLADPSNWNDNNIGTRTYDVLRNGSVIKSGLAYGITSYIDTSGTNGISYSYAVRYNNGCALSATTTGVSASDLVASAPTGLTNNTAADVDVCLDSGVRISWTQDPTNWNDNNSGTRTYDVLRAGTPIATGIAYGITSFIDTTGTNNLSYAYTVRYVNGCGITSTTIGASATDNVASAPSSITNNGAVDVSACAYTGVRITWVVPGSWGDNGFGTRTYDVLRDGTTIATGLSSSSTSFVDTAGTHDQAYLYQVRYNNGCALSSTTVGTSAADNTGAAPSGLTNNGAADLDGCADTGVQITWLQDPGDWGDHGTGTRYYRVYRNGVSLSLISYPNTNYIDTTGTNNTIYPYRILYINGCGTSSYAGAGASAQDHIASAPTGLTNNTAADLDSCADTGVRITWTQNPTDWGDGGTGTRTYDILRNGTAIVTGIAYGTTSYIDTTGSNNVSYAYTVRYVNGCGLSTVTAGANAQDQVGPPPSGLTNNNAADLNACADSGVQITWSQDPTDWGDGGAGMRTYQILRSSVPIATLFYGTTAYIDTGGTNNIIYTYKVAYVNGCGNSAATAGTDAQDQTGPPPSGLTNNTAADLDSCADTGVQITWTADAGDWGDGGIGTRTYDVLRNGIAIKTGLDYGSTSYVDTAGTNGIAYLYQVRYVNGCGITANTTGISAADFGYAPTGLTNNTAIDINGNADEGVRIGWVQDPSDWGDGGTGIRNYDVLRNGTAIASGLIYGTTNFVDTTGTNNVIYAYSVRYVNGCSFSSLTSGVDAQDQVCIAPSGLTNNTAADLNVCMDTGVIITWLADPGGNSNNWNDSGIGTRTYDVLRDGTAIAIGIAYGTTVYIDTSGTNGQTYTYAVRYNNGCSQSALTTGSSAADNIDIPCADMGNTLKVNKSGVDALISWNAVICGNFANYRVYGSTLYNTPFPTGWTILGNPTAPNFTDPLTSSNIAYKAAVVDLCGGISSYPFAQLR